MFTDNEVRELKILTQSITMRPLPMDKQESVKRGKDIWCADWWTIEVLKCLFHGESVYRQDPPPNRLKHNIIWSMEEICSSAENKRSMVKLLRENINFSDNLFICEVGRGIDLLLASFVKQWKRISCYDLNQSVLDEISIYFGSKIGVQMDVFRTNSGEFDFNVITDNTVIIANGTKIGEEQKKIIKNKPNILAIFDGRKL